MAKDKHSGTLARKQKKGFGDTEIWEDVKIRDICSQNLKMEIENWKWNYNRVYKIKESYL